jgi:hypothetical protein
MEMIFLQNEGKLIAQMHLVKFFDSVRLCLICVSSKHRTNLLRRYNNEIYTRSATKTDVSIFSGGIADY